MGGPGYGGFSGAGGRGAGMMGGTGLGGFGGRGYGGYGGGMGGFIQLPTGMAPAGAAPLGVRQPQAGATDQPVSCWERKPPIPFRMPTRTPFRIVPDEMNNLILVQATKQEWGDCPQDSPAIGFSSSPGLDRRADLRSGSGGRLLERCLRNAAQKGEYEPLKLANSPVVLTPSGNSISPSGRLSGTHGSLRRFSMRLKRMAAVASSPPPRSSPPTISRLRLPLVRRYRHFLRKPWRAARNRMALLYSRTP